ncbi:MAG: hypothetical protein ACXABY_13920 [Candidatus Thorarchaeota archaeon]|jgi:hypothetical protein
MANEWNTSYPIDHTLVSAYPSETRALKASAKTQIDREHETPVDGDATGGEHSSGAAVAYEGTSTPTNRPDGSTALADNAIDRGRLWLDDNSDPPVLKRWDGSAFEAVASSNLPTASGSTVFNTSMTAASTFQDLDLSATVGSKTALVHLEMTFTASDPKAYAVVTKGYAGSFANYAELITNVIKAAGPSAFITEDRGTSFVNKAQFTLMTDSSGVVQHAFSDNTTTVTVKLIGYIG